MIRVIKIVIGSLKFLMVLGIFESLAPGLSHTVTKELVLAAFRLGGK
jgi:hypothetical protein